MSKTEGIVEDKAVVDLAWTAGWDSTFRLLQLILVEGRVVRPHYIVRPESSTGQEIDAMNKIRRSLFSGWEKSRTLLEPTEFVDVRAIRIDRDLDSLYVDITKRIKINYQYLLLACYCQQVGISKMELGVLDGHTLGSESTVLFKDFSLPLLGLSKRELQESAKAHGFLNFMRLTVFCRRPKGGKPCGFCGPCHDAVQMGMGYRLPLRRRVIASLQSPLRSWWRRNYAQMDPTLKRVASRFLRGRY